MESIGGRLYVILDLPHPGVFLSLAQRLEESPASDTLRVVGIGWKLGDGSAAALLERAEGILGEHPGEAPLLEFLEAS